MASSPISEVIETLAANDITTKHRFGVGFFTNEEGARFAPDMMGSTGLCRRARRRGHDAPSASMATEGR
ncbi:MAG: hypothetical protein R2706_13640 [Acidimicrobiales bacterium]